MITSNRLEEAFVESISLDFGDSTVAAVFTASLLVLFMTVRGVGTFYICIGSDLTLTRLIISFCGSRLIGCDVSDNLDSA